MKNISAAIIVFFVMLFAYSKLIGPFPLSIHQVTTTKSDTFMVSGEGKVTVIPDIAVVTVGVQSQGTTVQQTQEDLNKKMNAVKDAIKKLGIDDKDIKTANYSIYPSYDYRVRPQKITGYNASSNLVIKVRKIDSANSVIDAATAQGANSVGGVSFDVDDKTKAENEARVQAVSEAKKKAEVAASAAGFRLGNVINYAEDFGGGRPYPLAAGKTMMAADAVAVPESAPTEVSPGSQEITITVTLSYEIR